MRDKTAERAISRLLDGNQRFVSKHGPSLKRHVSGQSPSAAVLTCSDSRVPPELIFDVGIGELFIVRDAGNVALGPSIIGSLEYAVEHLNVPLIVVMGHTCCGALGAAEKGPGDSSCIGEIVNEIRCCFSSNDHLMDNVHGQMATILERSPVIAHAVARDELKIVGAVYHLEKGTVEFF